MKNTIIRMSLIYVVFALSCKNTLENQSMGMSSIKNEVRSSEFYFASKRINEGFSNPNSTTLQLIRNFLEGDRITVFVSHAIEDTIETYVLTGEEKTLFFENPEKYHPQKTRRKSEYYDVHDTCYEFNNEGILHNSIYLTKLCFTIDSLGLSLKEIHLLDGD